MSDFLQIVLAGSCVVVCGQRDGHTLYWVPFYKPRYESNNDSEWGYYDARLESMYFVVCTRI